MTERMNGLVLAKVAAVEDPEAQGRIKVTYTVPKNEVTTDWIPVLSPFAGDARGFYAMPEPGDVCAVGFQNGDANSAFVLGFLWNGGAAPPADAVTERRWQSAQEHRITLSDKEEDGIVLEDRHGNRIAMTAQGIEITTPANLTIKADSQADVEAGATLNVKGATINLN